MSEAASRLARSRLAIIEAIGPAQERPARGEPAGLAGRLMDAVGTWWRAHPAHLGLELATPALSEYAARKPWRFLGLAAAGGALIAIIRPWRLLSITGLLMAVLKSPQLSSALLSALRAVDRPRGRPPREGPATHPIN